MEGRPKVKDKTENTRATGTADLKNLRPQVAGGEHTESKGSMARHLERHCS